MPARFRPFRDGSRKELWMILTAPRLHMGPLEADVTEFHHR